MRLDQLPQTEEDFYYFIDCITSTLGCGGTTPTEWIERSCEFDFSGNETKMHLQQILIFIVEKLCEEYQILNPICGENPLLSNSENYQRKMEWQKFDAWFNRMRMRFEANQYENLICSVCPYSEGARAFMEKGQSIVCKKNPKIKSLFRPWFCGMLSFGDWTEDDLYSNMVKEFGDNAWKRFFAMMLNLSLQESRRS